MAIQALATWPREAWSAEVTLAVQELHNREPRDDVKRRLDDLVEGKSIG